MSVQRTISPVDGSVVASVPLTPEDGIERILSASAQAQRVWQHVPLVERVAICERFVGAMEARADEIGTELTWQMGRPVRYTPNEIRRGFAERARHMARIAPEALADVRVAEQAGFTRFIRRTPLGVVLTIAPWNYPYLSAVNSIVPAILAGNSVVLKASAQTPLCAERFAQGFAAAGLPPGVFQYVHTSHDGVARMIADERVQFVAFTGSVEGGKALQRAAQGRFIGLGLELGGKDPAYVRPDAALADSVESLIDGALFNSGQCCCAIERIYVHRAVYDEFVARAVAFTQRYVLGHPLDPATTLGPLVRTSAAGFVRGQVAAAIQQGAVPHIDPALFPHDRPGTPYLAPQVLTNVTHAMRIMTEETFGPVAPIMRVSSDEEAVALMNDSRYGLTASIWTSDQEAALRLGDRIATGTWFMNRCDYLDPALAWSGVKDSGHGCALSVLGYGQLTRPKSFHLRAVAV